MQKLFGVSTNSIMVVMLILFALCMSAGLWVLLRQRVIFKLGIRNIPRRRAQSVLIVIGLMLSTLIMSAALTTGDTLDNSITSAAYSTMGETDEAVVLSNGNKNSNDVSIRTPFPQSVATQLQSNLPKNAPIDGVLPVLIEQVPTIDTNTNLHEPALSLTGLDPAAVPSFGELKDTHGHPIDFANLPAQSVVLCKTTAGEA